MSGRVEGAIWAASLLLLGAAGFAWLAAWPEPPLPHRTAPTRAEDRTQISPESLGVLVVHVAARDPFRFDRQPATVPYGSESAVAAAISEPATPPLRVTGVVGPPWRAVLEGAPGREGGVLVGVGDTLAGVRVHAIRGTDVVVRLRDASWTLSMRQP